MGRCRPALSTRSTAQSQEKCPRTVSLGSRFATRQRHRSEFAQRVVESDVTRSAPPSGDDSQALAHGAPVRCPMLPVTIDEQREQLPLNYSAHVSSDRVSVSSGSASETEVGSSRAVRVGSPV